MNEIFSSSDQIHFTDRLETHALIELKSTGIINADNNGILDRIAILANCHSALNAGQTFNGGRID